MSTYTAPIIAAAQHRSDEQIMDVIYILDRDLNGMTDKTGRTAANLRLVRAAMYELIEARYPWLDAILEAWCESDEDDRGYTQVIADALTAENVLV